MQRLEQARAANEIVTLRIKQPQGWPEWQGRVTVNLPTANPMRVNTPATNAPTGPLGTPAFAQAAPL